MENRSTLSAVLQSDNLPTLPIVATKILEATARTESELPEIADIISQDASLSTRILKAVNSPFYGLWNPVGSIKKAVPILGINAIRGLVLSFSLLNLKPGQDDRFDYQAFWETSLATAVTARRLLKELEATDLDEGFTAGLLANMGQLLLARACPARYHRVLYAKTGNVLPLEILENQILGIDHGSVGSEVARRWRLPSYLQIAMSYHQAPEEYLGDDPNLKRLVRVVHLSEILAEMLHSPSPQDLKEKFISRSLEFFGLDESLFQSLAAGVHEEVALAAESFGMRINKKVSSEEILQEANLRLGQLTNNYEQMSQELIRTQIELIQLGKTRQERPDNLHHMADYDPLTGAYNHRYLQIFLLSELSRPARKHPLCLILIKIDEFPAHENLQATGEKDPVLRELSGLLKSQVRPQDLVARWQSEVFALVLPETEPMVAMKVAQRIREAVGAHTFRSQNDEPFTVTCSCGISCQQNGRRDPLDVLNSAEKALSRAGRQGRNSIAWSENRHE